MTIYYQQQSHLFVHIMPYITSDKSTCTVAHDHKLSANVLPVVCRPTTNLMLSEECHCSVYAVTYIYNNVRVSVPIKPPERHPCYTHCALLLQCNTYILLCILPRVFCLCCFAPLLPFNCRTRTAVPSVTITV